VAGLAGAGAVLGVGAAADSDEPLASGFAASVVVVAGVVVAGLVAEEPFLESVA